MGIICTIGVIVSLVGNGYILNCAAGLPRSGGLLKSGGLLRDRY